MRWRRDGARDAYIDTQGMYPPVLGIECWARGMIVSPTMYDQILTSIARRKNTRCRPWKIAR